MHDNTGFNRVNASHWGLIMYDLKGLCIDILMIIAIACSGTVLMAATIKFIITYLF